MFRLLFLGLLVVAHTATAQTEITGKITDNHNKALSGISISIKDSYDGATSDSAGRFSFATSDTGQHLLQATATGYRAFEQNIMIGRTPLTINISMKEEITELKAVVITARALLKPVIKSEPVL